MPAFRPDRKAQPLTLVFLPPQVGIAAVWSLSNGVLES